MLKHFFESKYRRIALALTFLMFMSGGSLYYWHAHSVLLTADGHSRRIFTTAATLKEFLEREKIPMGAYDFSTPPLETPIENNTAAKITRVVHDHRVEISSGVPSVTWQLSSKENLRRVLVQKGFVNIATRHVQVTYHDGIEAFRTVLTVEKSRVPFHTLTLFDKSGRRGQQYDLLRSKVLKMRATGYYVGEKYVPSDTTFLGHKLRRGLVAVDPKVIPLRTRLYVQGYGYAFASDTGSAIKNMRIDLAVKNKTEELRFNRKNVPVYILEKAKSW